MEKEYKVKSDRYGHVHKFVQIPGGYYSFVPEKDWMPVYVTYNNKDRESVKFIDTEGGPIIFEGFETDEIRVTKIEVIGNGEVFTLEEKKRG